MDRGCRSICYHEEKEIERERERGKKKKKEMGADEWGLKMKIFYMGGLLRLLDIPYGSEVLSS